MLEEAGEEMGFPFEFSEIDGDEFILELPYCPYGFTEPGQDRACDTAMDMDRFMLRLCGAELTVDGDHPTRRFTVSHDRSADSSRRERGNDPMKLETESETLCHGGVQGTYRHDSEVLDCSMRLSVYRPPQAERGRTPVLYFLSGLTCTDENFTTKAGAQRFAAEHGITVVAPDTSPRGTDLPASTTTGTSAAEPASTSTPPRRPGIATIACTATSPRSCRR